jgi:hypothetical protein
MTFKDLVEEACENTSIEESVMIAAVTEYIKVVKRNVLKGFRCNVGDNFITVYPNIQCSVKDELNPDGTVKTPAEAKMVSTRNAVSRLGASVHKKFSLEFANAVSWQKVTAKGEVVDEEDINDGTQPTDNPGTGGNGGTDENPDGIE